MAKWSISASVRTNLFYWWHTQADPNGDDAVRSYVTKDPHGVLLLPGLEKLMDKA